MLKLIQVEFLKLRRRKFIWLMLLAALFMPLAAVFYFSSVKGTGVDPIMFYKWTAFSYTPWIILPVVLGMLCTMLMYNETSMICSNSFERKRAVGCKVPQGIRSGRERTAHPGWEGGRKNHREDTTDWNDKGNVEIWRAAWAAYTNRALESAGRPERIDHRSYKRQGIDKIPLSIWGQLPANGKARYPHRQGRGKPADRRRQQTAERN